MPDYRWSYYLTAPWDLVDEWYRAVKFGVRNLVQWFPVIWADRHYSGSRGLLKVIRRKLELMQGELSRDLYYVGAEHALRRMHVCALLVTRYLADGYGQHCEKRHEEKWGPMRFFREPDYDRETGDIDPDNCIPFCDWPNAHTPELREKAWKEMYVCSDYACRQADAVIQYLFGMLSKYYRRW